MMPTIRVATIKVPVIRKKIKALPKSPKFREPVRVLNKQLSAYEKYERDGDEPGALAELKKSIPVSVGIIQKLISA